MPHGRKKQRVIVDSIDSLSGLIQETYNDSCKQIMDAQKIINEISSGHKAADVQDMATIAKSKTDALKSKDNAIKMKLELAKLQVDFLKNKGNTEDTGKRANHGVASLDDFKKIRQIVNESKSNRDINNPTEETLD